jgi:translation factor GUF1, mitochondrial
MLTPKEYIGSLMELAQDRRGVFKEMNYITQSRASIIYELPLAEVSLHCLHVLCSHDTTDVF